MVLSVEEMKSAVEKNFREEPDITAYSIRVNGKTFVTDAGKMAWKKKGYARMAFKQAIEPLLRRAVQEKLLSQGMDRIQIYGESEYIRAFDNYMRYLENNNLFQIVELTTWNRASCT